MHNKGILAVVSGFSGSGKGTLMKKLIGKYEEMYSLSISVTTRAPRKSEAHKRDYYFIDKDQFEKMIAKNELIEYARYVGNYYGTPRKFVEDKLAEGKDVILEIDMQGALKVKEKYPDALLLFVTPPSAKSLQERLRARGTESEEAIASRMRQAIVEAEEMNKYDYIIINDVLEDCVEQMHDIVQVEKLRVFRNNLFLDNIKVDLKGNLKGDS